MKKNILIIILIIVLLAFIFIGLYYFDLYRTVEKPEYPVGSYSINETNDSISYTFYGDGNGNVKTTTTYLFKDNLLSEIKYEIHYSNKYYARNNAKYSDKKYGEELVNENNINYVSSKDNESIGKTKEEIKEIYSWLEESDQFTKIN